MRQRMSDSQLLDLFGRTTCEVCGERLDDDGNAEMYDPERPGNPSLIVHADCGINEGLEVA